MVARFSSLLLLVVVVTLASTTAVFAQDTDEARAQFEVGREHYEHGRYQEAAAAFERAYALTQSPELLYNIYTATQRSGDLVRAAEALELYLASDVVPAAERPPLQARLMLMREQAEAQRLERLAADEADRLAAEEERRRIAEAERRAEEAERRARRGVSPLAIASFSVGGAGLVGFAVLAGFSAREDGRVSASCGQEVGMFCTDGQVRKLRRLTLSADIALGIGAAGIVTGLIAYFVQRDGQRGDEAEVETARLHLAPAIAPTAVGLRAWGSF